MKKSVKKSAALQALHQTCMLCIAALEKKGYSNQEAESMVLGTLKESEEYLKNGMITATSMSLRMIYLS